jgi:hypothetical protein
MSDRVCWFTGKQCPTPTVICDCCWVKLGNNIDMTRVVFIMEDPL